MIRRTRMPRRSPSSRCVSASCAGSSWRRSTVAGSPSAAGGGDVRDGGGREETAASSGDDRSVRERRSVVRRRRTTGENNDVGGEGKHAAQVHLTALLPQPPEVEKVRQDASTNKLPFVRVRWTLRYPRQNRTFWIFDPRSTIHDPRSTTPLYLFV